MAELDEATCKRILDALGRKKYSKLFFRPAEEWPDCPAVLSGGRMLAKVPCWRIVQRAASPTGKEE